MRTINKLLLSLGVIGAFIAYSWHQRNESASSSAVLPPVADTTSANKSSDTSTATNTTRSPASAYKDGSYTGSASDAYYGYIQVRAVIKDGKITDVVFLQYPNDQENSIAINTQAMPYLKQEAIQAQSADVNVISGATDTSQAFVQSLADALDQAKKA